MFRAPGVEARTPELIKPGGIGIFGTTMLAAPVLLGVGSVSAVPVPGYRLFNFWLPTPLAVVFHPTPHRRRD